MMMMMRVTHSDVDNVSITSVKDELVMMVRFNYKLLYEMGMMIKTHHIVMIGDDLGN